MQFKREKLRNCVGGCDRLVKDYFDRTNAGDGVPSIDMDWVTYLRLEEHGKLAVFTARDDDDIIQGFAMYVVMLNPHYRTKFFAECDIIAVCPECRGKGVARTLIEIAEGVFRRMGVDRMVHKFRTVYDTEPLFPKLGFVEAERTYMKVL